MSLILECPHCHDCHKVEDWNKANEGAEALGRIEEPIPVNDDLDWDEYAIKKSGVMDCPSCGEVCNYEDMNIV